MKSPFDDCENANPADDIRAALEAMSKYAREQRIVEYPLHIDYDDLTQIRRFFPSVPETIPDGGFVLEISGQPVRLVIRGRAEFDALMAEIDTR